MARVLKGTVRRDLTGVESGIVDRYPFKDLPLDLKKNIFQRSNVLKYKTVKRYLICIT